MLTKSQEKLKQKCIDHWFENLMMLQLNYLSGHEDLGEDVYVTGDGCPFCQRYGEEQRIDEQFDWTGCNGCPISEMTKEEDCGGTPWYDVHYFFDSFGVPRSVYKNLFKAIGKEIDFLIAL